MIRSKEVGVYLSKIALGISIICGVALTVFFWMPLFALGGLIGAASSFLFDGSRWYGSFYRDRAQFNRYEIVDDEPTEIVKSEAPSVLPELPAINIESIKTAVMKPFASNGGSVLNDPDEQYMEVKFS
jgi:hypothetical protein